MELEIPTARAFVPLLKQGTRYKGIHGGRGSGKSHFFAEDAMERAAFDDIRIVCIREVQKSLDQSVKRLIEDKIEKFGLQRYFRVLRTHIEGTQSNSRIIFQGMQNHTADSIKSLEGYDVAWVEEAQTLSQRSLDLLRPTIRKPMSELWFSWNPYQPTDPVDALLRGKDAPPNATVVEANYWDNPYFPDVLREEMRYDRRRDPIKYRHIWGGGYLTNSEARVFKNWKIEDFDTPEGVVFYFGADWGFSVDPTVLIRCWIEGRTIYIDHEAYAIGCDIDHTPGLFAGLDPNPKGFRGIPGASEWRIIADSAGPQQISYMRRQGFDISPSIKGPGSVEEGIRFLQSYDIVVHPRCIHTIDELTHYSFKVDPKTQLVTPVLSDKKNHVIDSLRYAVENVRRATPKTRTRTTKGLH